MTEILMSSFVSKYIPNVSISNLEGAALARPK